MEARKGAPQALLIMGILYAETISIECIEKKLIKKYGPILKASTAYDFHHTKYYNDEMGSKLKRKYYAFERLIKKKKLSAIKTHTNRLEQQYARDAKRQVNLDPGYVDLSKLVLASAKDFSHRIFVLSGCPININVFLILSEYFSLSLLIIPILWRFAYISHGKIRCGSGFRKIMNVKEWEEVTKR